MKPRRKAVAAATALQAGSAELFRILELLCGFYLFTICSRNPLPIHEPQSRANYAPLCATRFTAAGYHQNHYVLYPAPLGLADQRPMDLGDGRDDVVQVGVGPFRTEIHAGVTVLQVN